MKTNIIKILMFFLFLIAFAINYYYGGKGVFPIDTFAHFDTSYRILNGASPIKDYWATTGLTVDYLQSLFFLIFGVNWTSYLIHPSLVNASLTLAIFILFRKFKLNKYICFFYSICFAILAYPSVGVPFPDHHSAFFSLFAIIFLLLAIKENNFFYWFLIPIFFFIAFFSKQTPAGHIILFSVFFVIYYSFITKKTRWIIPVSIGIFVNLVFLFSFLMIEKIDFNLFITQYFLFPQSIGLERINDLNFTLRGSIFHFKFVYLAFVPIILFTLSGIIKNKSFLKSKEFFNSIIILFFSFCLIFHQLITKNQTFIFFLIPFILGFSHASIKFKKYNVYFTYFLLFLCLFTSIKYHLRFNEDRKFMELSNININLSKKAEHIDDKLSGLKWITPEYHHNVEEELLLIKDTINHLKIDNNTIMVLTHYQFLSAIIEKDLISPNRWFTTDGISYPLLNHKYFEDYKNYFKDLVLKKNVDLIYTIKPIGVDAISSIFNEDCLDTLQINKILYQHKLDKCN